MVWQLSAGPLISSGRNTMTAPPDLAEVGRAITRLPIPANPRLILHFMLSCAGSLEAERFPKRSTIANALHISRRTVNYALDYLTLAGLITPSEGRRGGRGRATCWLIDVARILTANPEPVPTIRARTASKGAACDALDHSTKGATCAPPIDTRTHILTVSETEVSERGSTLVRTDLEQCIQDKLGIEPAPPAPPTPGQPARWPENLLLPEPWLSDGAAARADAKMPPADLRRHALKFVRVVASPDCRRPVRSDWHGYWLQWALDDLPPLLGTPQPRLSGKADNAANRLALAVTDSDFWEESHHVW